MPIQNSISNAIKGSIINGGGPAGDFSTKSLSFDGIDEYISTSEVYSELDGQSKMSLSCWVKPNLDSNDVVVWINAAAGRVIGLVIYSTGMVRLQTQTSGNYAATSTGAVVANTWQHIMVCMDLSLGTNVNRGRIFIDGQDLTSGNNTYNGTFETSNGSFRIGSSTVGNYYGGLLDEVAIWAGQDLRNDVATIYNNGKPADLTSLNPTSWYRAGESSTFAYPQILMPEDTNKNKLSKYSLAFDGTSDYIDCGDPDEFSFGNTKVDSRFSISAWIKIGQTTTQGIVTKYGSTSATREYLFYITGGKLRLLLSSTNGGYNFATGTTNLSINTWYHVACTYDGRGGSTAYDGMTLYINGIAESVTTTNSLYIAMSNTSQNVEIGKHLTNELLGNIDEVAIFPVDLGLSDVQAIYNSGVPTDISSYSPLGYWKLGEEAKFTDNWLVPNSALSNFSKYSFNFDGVDDYVDCGQVTQIQNTNALSVSCWFNYNSLSSSVNGIVSKDSTNRIDGNWYISTQLATIRFLLKTANGQDALNSGTISLNSWNHLLCVWNGSTMSIYINGTLDNSISLSNATGTLGLRISDVMIGRRLVGAINDGFFNGGIDEVAVWNSDQSANASTIYNGGKPKDLSGLSPVSWWRMGEEATYDGTLNQFTIPDQAGTNNGTSSNTMLLETLVGDTPQYYGGGISDSMDIFDRVGDAPNSENNTVSFNMEEADIVEDTP